MIDFTRTHHYPHISLDAAVGWLPQFWSTTDPRPAVEQHNSKPAPGGPWNDFSKGWHYDPTTESLQYGDASEPDADPPYYPLAYAVLPLTRQRIIVYPHAWVMILNDDGTFTIDQRD